ncbi:MAG: polymer-forming cytoskeletal protein [Candidatus Andersenbacteria bacterium]|nr:polymer-forming cytoskeletal protein [Candidatus Andersenbacteria bacterium]
MKQLFITSISLASLVLLPSTALAAQFRSGDTVGISGETINENTYIAGGQVNVTSPINGDVLIGGGDIKVTSPIKGDVFIGGGDITLSGPITGDVRMAGGDITINSKISGELFIGGGQVTISSDASTEEVWAGAGQLTIAGSTGPVMTGVGQLIITDTAKINGDISYTSQEEAKISPNATITGEVNRHIPPMPEGKKPAAAAIAGTSLISLLSSFIMLILIMYAMPNKAVALANSWRQNFASNLLWGILTLIVTPIVAFILLISFIGLPLGLITIVFYLVGLYLANLVTVLAIGMWIRSLWIKTPAAKIDWLSALLGLLAIAIISIMPIIGAAAIFVAFVAGLGTLVRHDWGLYQRLRQNKEF